MGVVVAAGMLAFCASALATTQTFHSIGKEQEFVVPAGVTELRVEAIGAHAASSGNELGGQGGIGATVAGNVKVSPGPLYVEVGGPGSGRVGGFNGGGGSGTSGGKKLAIGGGGGGASDVRTVSRFDEGGPGYANSQESRLLVAAGGGGGGGVAFEDELCAGGEGGNAGVAGGAGATCGEPAYGLYAGGAGGGGPGSGTGILGGGYGGQGYPTDVDNGGQGAYGNGGGGAEAGGGGGGGLEGGGGGGAQTEEQEYPTFAAGGYGGGGGGSSLVPAGGSSGLDVFGFEPLVTITYTVAAPPTAEIKSPPTNGTYKQGEVIHTKFSCSEGAGGPGIASCADENSVSSPEEGTLETTMLGSHTYTVTAKSKDGFEGSAKIEYSVIPAPPACKTAEGAGTYKKRGEAGRLSLRDKLSTSTTEAQFLQVSTEPGAVHFGLKKLTSVSCGAIEGGFAFSGEGPAREYKKTGYTIHFSISISKGKTYFSSTLSKGATVIHEAIGEPLSKSNEVIH